MKAMRIVAGELKGMHLTQTVSKSTRPTSDSVRESIFNIISARFDFDSKKVADLYAGTGALGIEAFSRGASEVIFVETDQNACITISKNIQTVEKRMKDATDALKVVRNPVLTFVQARDNREKFDLVLADPPYDNDVEIEVMDVVSPSGYLVYETTAKKLEQCESQLEAYPRTEKIIVSRKMGSTGVVVVQAI